MVELAVEAVPVLLLAHAGLQRAEHAELALHRHAARMGHVDHLPGDRDVVVVVGGALAVGLEAAVHHHAGEAVLDGGGAGGGVVAMVLVHAHRDVRIELDQAVDQVFQHDVVGVGPRSAARLDDDRRVDGLGRLHDRQALLHVVDVERRQAVVVLGRVIEKLPQSDARHGLLPPVPSPPKLKSARNLVRST